MSTPIAVVSALVAALFLGTASVADERSTKQVKTERTLSPRILLDLVRQPLWLIAMGANIVGFAFQVVALAFGSIAVVEPLLVFDLVFAVLIARFLRKRAGVQFPGGESSARITLAGVGATTVGVAGFLVIGQPSAGHANAGFAVLVPLVIGLTVVLGGCLAVASRNENLRPLALALACGVCFGVTAFAVKLLTSEFGAGPAMVFTNWPVYLLVVVGPAGFILNENAFQQDRSLAPVQAIITSADPVISIGLGVLLLGVRLRSSPAEIFAEIASLLLMITGIVIVARAAPQVTKPQAASPPAGVRRRRGGK
jgi:hypothetical protein